MKIRKAKKAVRADQSGGKCWQGSFRHYFWFRKRLSRPPVDYNAPITTGRLTNECLALYVIDHGSFFFQRPILSLLIRGSEKNLPKRQRRLLTQ